MFKQKKAVGRGLLFEEDSCELQNTSSFSSPGESRRNKGGKRSSLSVINSGHGAIDPFEHHFSRATSRSSSPYSSNSPTSQAERKEEVGLRGDSSWYQ